MASKYDIPQIWSSRFESDRRVQSGITTFSRSLEDLPVYPSLELDLTPAPSAFTAPSAPCAPSVSQLARRVPRRHYFGAGLLSSNQP